MIQYIYEKDKLGLICIDEAHCIVEYGNIRSDYKKLSIIREQNIKVPILLMTATATKYIRDTIK